MRQEVMHEEAVRISKRILEPDSPNKKKWNWNQATNAQNYSPT